jgi:hypothetical protein
MHIFAHFFLSTFPVLLVTLLLDSVAPDDKWLLFQVEKAVAAKQLLGQL